MVQANDTGTSPTIIRQIRPKRPVVMTLVSIEAMRNPGTRAHKENTKIFPQIYRPVN
jgi:hypothetical protein